MSGLRNKWGILQVVNMGTLISTLDVGIVNVSLPLMARQFSVTLAQIQWVATAYLLTMVVLLPFFGKMSDRMERRKVYSYGFLIFGVGSLCIAVSHSFMLLLLSRCLQGVGATMIMANSQAMVRHAFPDHERGRALGYNQAQEGMAGEYVFVHHKLGANGDAHPGYVLFAKRDRLLCFGHRRAFDAATACHGYRGSFRRLVQGPLRRKFSDPCRSGVMFRIHVIRHVLADGSGMEHWSPFSRFRHWYGIVPCHEQRRSHERGTGRKKQPRRQPAGACPLSRPNRRHRTGYGVCRHHGKSRTDSREPWGFHPDPVRDLLRVMPGRSHCRTVSPEGKTEQPELVRLMSDPA